MSDLLSIVTMDIDKSGDGAEQQHKCKMLEQKPYKEGLKEYNVFSSERR